MRKVLGYAGIGLAALSTAAAYAQGSFPAKPVRIVVPFPAGGTADVLPRIVGEELSKRWKQPVIVENRTGANGNIAASFVYRSDPDGYTTLWSPPGPLAINQYLYKTLAFDPTRFAPITILGSEPNALSVGPSSQFSSIGDIVAYARNHPGKLSVASQGVGSTSHLTAEMLQDLAGIRMTHVPYQGAVPALADVMSGQVDLFFGSLGSSFTYFKANRLKIIALTDSKRSDRVPAIPTAAESGFSELISTTWFGVVAPPNTPQDIVRKISHDVNEILKMPEVIDRFIKQGAAPMGATPEESSRFMKAEGERWHGIIKAAAITLD